MLLTHRHRLIGPRTDLESCSRPSKTTYGEWVNIVTGSRLKESAVAFTIQRLYYFFRPTDRFFNLRSEVRHLRQRSASKGLRAPHRRHTLKNSRLFCAICFFVTSAIGKIGALLELRWADGPQYKCLVQGALPRVRGGEGSHSRRLFMRTGTSIGVIATPAPAFFSALILESAVP